MGYLIDIKANRLKKLIVTALPLTGDPFESPVEKVYYASPQTKDSDTLRENLVIMCKTEQLVYLSHRIEENPDEDGKTIPKKIIPRI